VLYEPPRPSRGHDPLALRGAAPRLNRFDSVAGPRKPPGFCSFLGFTLLGMLAAFVLAVLLINFVLLPWHVNMGREATVPDVVGMTRDEAERALKSQGFAPGDARYVADTAYAAGKVVDTRPRVGTRVKVGRVIGLDISAGQEKTEVPSVVRLPTRRAQAAIENAGLRVGEVEMIVSLRVPEGEVVSTNPASGTIVNKGTAVNLTVSMGAQGLVEMPRLKGLPLGRARDIILNNSLTLAETTEVISAEPSGIVLSQEPAEGTQIQAGAQVRLTISHRADTTSSAPKPKKPPAKETKPQVKKKDTKSAQPKPKTK